MNQMNKRAEVDFTLINLNMLVIKYVDSIERERHITLGPLYLASDLLKNGISVDFKDYQLYPGEDIFSIDNFLKFIGEPAKIVGISCMANLLHFAILCARAIKERYPDRKIILGGVGPFGVEERILKRFDWIDFIVYGEASENVIELIRAIYEQGDFSRIKGIYFRRDGEVIKTEPQPRKLDLDSAGLPAYQLIEYKSYEGHNMITSRGCPYKCTFCSVAPIWGRSPAFRTPENVVNEMVYLNREFGVRLFLFQDEFFLNSKERVIAFCENLRKSGMQNIYYKIFARVDLIDREVLRALAKTGCVEIRFGIESGSDDMLKRLKKGFTVEQANRSVSEALKYIPRVDTFFIWGFPFESMKDFSRTLFQMISYRMIGARILPSLICYLPQTDVYKELVGSHNFEFYGDILPEFVITGQEVCEGGRLRVTDEYKSQFDFIKSHPDIFTGFFQIDLENNILPKFNLLIKHGFYQNTLSAKNGERESCGGHSPRVSKEGSKSVSK